MSDGPGANPRTKLHDACSALHFTDKEHGRRDIPRRQRVGFSRMKRFVRILRLTTFIDLRGVSISVHPERFLRRVGTLTSPSCPQNPLSLLFPLHTGHSPVSPVIPTLTRNMPGVPPHPGPRSRPVSIRFSPILSSRSESRAICGSEWRDRGYTATQRNPLRPAHADYDAT